MERMLGDLLDLTRARLGGSMPLNRRPADLQQLCAEALIEIRAGQPDAVLRFEGTGDLRGEWDADRLTQVLSNLVGNAIQHGGGNPVTLTRHEDGESVTLTVHFVRRHRGSSIARATAGISSTCWSALAQACLLLTVRALARASNVEFVSLSVAATGTVAFWTGSRGSPRSCCARDS